MPRHTFFCIDGHTCGNPVRLVAGGGPLLPHAPMLDRRQVFMRDHDWVRTALMFEPRGHDVMSGTILYPAFRDDCDVGVIYIEVSGCLPMCGHGTIGTVTFAIEEGLVTPRTPGRLALDTPAGRVDAYFEMDGTHVASVRIHNVPSFLYATEVPIEVEGLGRLVIDVAYGGNFYAIIEPQPNYPGIDALGALQLIALSPKVRRAAQSAVDAVHPDDARIRGVSHIMWCDAPREARAHARNAVFYGDKAIDRSPCGTGTSARMAQLAAKGRLKPGDAFVHESIIGTLFDGRVESATEVSGHAAIRPSVAGWSRITGHNTIFVDDRDPLRHGFQVL
ncbi:MAG TPA: 4-hydroxyproline epimerase [Acidisphaera sp.]|nr:4-hydroxyproline epimerase [Acidisphaera sp.]